jgi:hypothetical protein
VPAEQHVPRGGAERVGVDPGACVGINPIVTLEKQLLNMTVNLV